MPCGKKRYLLKKEACTVWAKGQDGKEEEEKGRVGEKEEDILEARTEEEKGMEAKEMGRGKEKAFKGHAGHAGKRGTQRWNARKEKEKEEREEEEEIKGREKGHLWERAICVESGDIRQSIAPKARAKEEEEE